MILTHVAGTVGGATASGAAFIIGASTAASHASIYADIVIALAGTVGAVVAVVSFMVGRKKDPSAAIIAHAQLDDQRNLVIDTRLSEISRQLDTLVSHALQPSPPTAPAVVVVPATTPDTKDTP